jgi:LPS-assembly lipoprotein
MLKNRRLFCALLVSTVMLSACGFKLRGSLLGDNLPFKSIYINLPENSPLAAELRRNIRGSGELKIATKPENAEAILDVTNETREKIILSLNSQGRVRQFGLNYRATIRVRDNNQAELLAPTTIALKRDISYNEDQILAKDAEEAMIYRDMQSDLVQQILRRIAAIKPIVKADDDTTGDVKTTVSAPAGSAAPANFSPAPSRPVPVTGNVAK